MSFTLIINNIPEKDLGSVLAHLSLPKAATYTVNHIPKKVSEAPTTSVVNKRGGVGKATPDTGLHMTGKIPRSSEKFKTTLTLFEKLEAKEGIGSVTVAMFRDHLHKHKQEAKLLSRLLNEGYLEYLP